MPQIDKLLQMAVQNRASDLHLATGSPFIMRQFGALRTLKSQPLAAESAQKLFYEILSEPQRKELEENRQLDFSYVLKGVARFRCNIIRQRKGLDGTFRVVPLKIPTIDELGLPPVVKKFCDFHQGLLLVTGATGQGKTTTMASMVDFINGTRPDHILTVEDPIEFIHPIKKAVVNQRQLGMHTRSFSNALRAALREDPDVIMVGELRDLESIELAVSASETGHLVIATMSTSSGPKTVDRLIDSFPPDEQNQIRAMLAESLRAVLTQKLIPRADGKGLVLAAEVLVGTTPMGNLIRAEKTFQIPNLMATGRSLGMQSMDDSLMNMYKAGVIAAEQAYRHCMQKKLFAQLLKGQGGAQQPAAQGKR
jgi:twitching motility protein PilT